METFLELWNLYGGQVVRILLEVLALVALTRWGQANRTALHATAEAIERMAALWPNTTKQIKELVAEGHADLPDDAQAALQSAVAQAEDVVLGLTAKPRTGSGREIVGVAARLLPMLLRILVTRRALLLIGTLGLVTIACVTTQAPDGTRTTRMDVEAVEALAPLVDHAADRIAAYQSQRDQARAAGDQAEVERYERLIDYWETLRQSRPKALQAAQTPVPLAPDAEPEPRVEAPAPPAG